MAVTIPTQTHGAADRPDAAELDGLVGIRAPSSRPGVALGVALLLVTAYAAFAHGGANYPDEARLQVLLALLGVVAAALWLWHGGLRLRAPAAAWAGLGLLAAFAVWCGLSLAWTIAPSGTWVQLNRTIAYVLVAGIAVAVGAWDRRALERIAGGYAAVALLVALYALGGKVAPQVFHHTDDFSRLRAPLDYWNALAIFLVMAVPILLRGAVDTTRDRRLRIGALAGLAVLLVAIGMTLSRGGVVALVAALALAVALGGEGTRLRSLLFTGMTLLAAAPAIAVGFGAGDLTTNGVPASERAGEGLLLAAVLLVGLAALVLAARVVMNVEARTLPDAARSRRVGRVLLAALAALALAGVGAMAVSDRGLTGTIDHQVDVFTTAKQGADRFDPARLLTTNSGNRWVWWEEAAGGWSDRPFQGWGAGSFALLHRRYRENDLDVLQPHSVPLQFLSETGLLGALLGLGGLGLLGAAALGTVRRLPAGRERGLAAALFAGAGASAIQGLYEWNWDIPAATLPALIFAGVLAGARTHARAQDTTEVPRPPTTGLKLGALAAATLLMCTVAISAGIPSWADSKADSAILAVSGKPSPQELADAEAEAELAARLDPLAVDPLFTASTIAGRRGHPRAARDYVVEAITRQPDNPRVWLRLASVGAGGRQGPEARFAIRKALALDPRNKAAIGLASLDLLLATPPEASATATGTPLPTIIPQLTPEQIGEFLSTGKLPPGYPKYDLPGSPTG